MAAAEVRTRSSWSSWSLFSFFAYKNGQLAITHATRTAAVLHPQNGPITYATGIHAEPEVVSIQSARAAASGKGEVHVVAVDQDDTTWYED